MNIGVVNRVLGCGLLGLVALACGGSDDPAANCGTASAPKPFAIKDLSPALGASVPNSAIVQSFTLVGQHLQIVPTLGLPQTHTAGFTVPAQVQWTATPSGADTVYSSAPFSWEKQPAHVEILSTKAFGTDDGCIWELPEPFFEYDITAP